MLDKMKIKNLTKIMVCILSKQVTTKADLVENTELSNSTVSSAVNSLIKLDLLEKAGFEESIGGRRSTIYKMNSSYAHFLGIGLYKNNIHFVITNFAGEFVESFGIEIEPSASVIKILINAIEKVMGTYPKIIGIGIGLDAEINYKEQIIISCDAYNWKQVHLKEILERKFLTFIYIDHLANGVAYRERLFGYAKETENYLCYHESAQTKAALVLNNSICRGQENYTGKIDSIHEFFEHIDIFIKFLDVSKIIIRYFTEEFKNMANQLAKEHQKTIICIEQMDNDVEIGMAISAQREWFKSVYFML